MSSGSQEKRAVLLEELVRELRQFNGLAASFFRAASGRIGMTVTDMQVIDILDSTGPTTAGRLADLTGLTTGAITGMLNRLEETGLVRRERDPNDGRRVIVCLVSDKDKMQEIALTFDTIEKAWDEIVSHYNDEQIVFLLEFLRRSNATSRKEIVRLREAPEDEGRIFSTPLENLESAQLVVSSGFSRLTLHTDEAMTELYQAHFEGSVPDVKAKDGAVTIRYPRRLWSLMGEKRIAEVTLSTAIPWRIMIQGGAVEITAELARLDLAGLEIKGGLSTIRLELPTPSSVVPIRISGGAAEIIVHRPAGVPARAHLKGWVSEFVFDGQRFSSVGNDVRLQSPDYEATTQGYDIEVSSSASAVTVTSGQRRASY